MNFQTRNGRVAHCGHAFLMVHFGVDEVFEEGDIEGADSRVIDGQIVVNRMMCGEDREFFFLCGVGLALIAETLRQPVYLLKVFFQISAL